MYVCVNTALFLDTSSENLAHFSPYLGPAISFGPDYLGTLCRLSPNILHRSSVTTGVGEQPLNLCDAVVVTEKKKVNMYVTKL